MQWCSADIEDGWSTLYAGPGKPRKTLMPWPAYFPSEHGMLKLGLREVKSFHPTIYRICSVGKWLTRTLSSSFAANKEIWKDKPPECSAGGSMRTAKFSATVVHTQSQVSWRWEGGIVWAATQHLQSLLIPLPTMLLRLTARDFRLGPLRRNVPPHPPCRPHELQLRLHVPRLFPNLRQYGDLLRWPLGSRLLFLCRRSTFVPLLLHCLLRSLSTVLPPPSTGCSTARSVSASVGARGEFVVVDVDGLFARRGYESSASAPSGKKSSLSQRRAVEQKVSLLHPGRVGTPPLHHRRQFAPLFPE